MDTLGNVLAQVSHADVQKLLFVVGDLANGVDLLNTVGAELDVGRKVVTALVLVQRRVDEGRLNDVLLALGGFQEGLCEARTSHGHREGSGTSAILSLDDLVTTELHAVNIAVKLLALEVDAGLREERNDGCAGVATNNSDVLVGGVGALNLGNETRGTDDVEGCDTEDALGVVDALGLEDLGGDGDGGIDLSILTYCSHASCACDMRTGFEMIKMLASGAWSAAALARSRTIEALVLKRSGHH